MPSRLRRHAVFLAVLAAGAGLRAVTLLAYRPALIYPDSIWYLRRVADLRPAELRPVGYSAFLRLLPVGRGLGVVPLVQHVLALAVAVLLYALLVRLEVRPWAAALGTAPFLLDAFQLLVEQSLLSETLFEALLAGACALLLWRRPLGPVAAGAAAVLLAAAAVTRPVALALVVPALITVAVVPGRPSRPVVALALLVCFALPLAAYAEWYRSAQGEFAIAGSSGHFLYARVAPFADCSRFPVPADERALCPPPEMRARGSPQFFAWSHRSPFFRLPPAERNARARDFSLRVIRHRPLAYAGAVASDLTGGFALTRSTSDRLVPFSGWWEFQPRYPLTRPSVPTLLRAYGDGPGRADPPLVSLLRSYQRFAFTPGPLLALGLLVALVAALAARSARQRPAALLLGSLGLALPLVAAAVHQLSPRYMLPELVLLPAALALGATALSRRSRAQTPRSPRRPSLRWTLRRTPSSL